MAKRKWLTPKQAAEYCGVSESFLYDRRDEGETPVFHRMGRKVLYDEADLDRFIELACVVTLNRARA